MFLTPTSRSLQRPVDPRLPAESFHNELLSVIGFIICHYTQSPQIIQIVSSVFVRCCFYFVIIIIIIKFNYILQCLLYSMSRQSSVKIINIVNQYINGQLNWCYIIQLRLTSMQIRIYYTSTLNYYYYFFFNLYII